MWCGRSQPCCHDWFACASPVPRLCMHLPLNLPHCSLCSFIQCMLLFCVFPRSGLLFGVQGSTGSVSRHQVSLTLMPPTQFQNCLPVPLHLGLRLADAEHHRAKDLDGIVIAPGSDMPLPFAHRGSDAGSKRHGTHLEVCTAHMCCSPFSCGCCCCCLCLCVSVMFVCTVIW